MTTMMTLPSDIRYVRLASLAALKIAEIFTECINTKMGNEDFCHAFELSVSEAFTNSVLHAEPSEQENTIILSFCSNSNNLTVTVSDSNPPFAIGAPSLDISSYPENGYGLFLIHQLMDNVSYARENGTNRVSMTKQYHMTEGNNL